MNLSDRVNIGNSAREFLDLIGTQPIEFWESLADEIKRRDLLQTEQPEEEMNIKQHQIFREVVMPFGVHQGTKIKDIPESYLCNLLDPSPFMKKLQLYVSYLQRRSGE